MKTKKKTDCPEQCKMGRIGNRPLWVLYLSVGIRAGHQVGCAVFLATVLLQPGKLPPPLYMALAFISGAALLLSEGMRHRQFYRELAGLSTIIKLLLLGAAYHGFLPLAPTILVVFILASISSHAPKVVRHRLLL